MRRLLAGVFVAALVFSVCGGDDDDSAEADTTTTAVSSETTADGTAATTVPETTAPCPPLDGGTQDPSTEPATGDGSGLLTDVAVTTGDCTDAVSFTFTATGSGPGYTVEYQDGPITQDGSGDPIDVAGSAFLAVRFTPAFGFDFDTNQQTYTGPDSITSAGAFFVQEVAETGDFEGVVGWVIGLDQERDYVVDVSGTDTTVITISIR